MLEFIALVLCELALLTNIMGIAVPYWSVISEAKKKYVYYGLWKSCTAERCIYHGASVNLDAVRSMELLGMFAIMGACTCIVLRRCKLLNHSVVPLVSGVMALTAGIFMTTGLIIFVSTEFNKDALEDLHAGFGLCVTSSLLAFGAGGVLFFETMMS